MSKHLSIIVATHLAAGAVGYWLAPKEALDTQVKQSGYFRTDTSKVLSATVESLRSENKLLVFSYKGTVQVEAKRSELIILTGVQRLIIPGVVNYYIDLSKLGLEHVTYNETAKLVTVRLPRLELGDIAFQPENATTINGGILTFSDDQVASLLKANYATARRAFTSQAQGRGLVDAAKTNAKANITNYFEIPLRIAGLPDVKVIAVFD